MPKLLTILILLGLISCNPTKDLTGRYYRYVFDDVKLFGTRLKFDTANSLRYAQSYDRVYDSSVGSYRIYKKKLYVVFQKVKVDTNNPRAHSLTMPLRFDTVGSVINPYQYLFYLGNNKIFFSERMTGKKMTKFPTNHKQKKYILFGPHFYNDRCYMKRLN